MAGRFDDMFRGTFESLGLPNMPPGETLQWLRNYGSPVQIPQPAPTPASAPSHLGSSVPAMTAYAPSPSQNPALTAASTLGQPGAALPQRADAGGGLFDLLQSIFGGRTGSARSLPRSTRQTPSQGYSDRNTMAGMTAIQNSRLSLGSQDRASRARSGGDAHGLTENGNPGWWRT